MIKKEIRINYSGNDFYRKYIEIYKPVYLSILKYIHKKDVPLCEKEIEVYCTFIRYYNISEITNKEKRYSHLLGRDMRRVMRNELGMNTQLFNVYINKLREKKILLKNGINKYFLIVEHPDTVLSFRFVKNDKGS